MVELLTLGDASIRHDGADLGGLSAHRQKFALLTYLAVEGPVPRDHLLAIFWPERDEEKARHSLSQVLYALKQELGDECVSAAGDAVGVAANVAVDAARFETAARQENYQEAVEIYGGPFLERFTLPEAPAFDDWQSRTRTRLARLAGRAFRHVVERKAESGDLAGALAVAAHWTDVEPLEDEAQHSLIALLAQTGNRTKALSHYDAYRERLARELEVEPLEETVALVDRIRAGEQPEFHSLADVGGRPKDRETPEASPAPSSATAVRETPPLGGGRQWQAIAIYLVGAAAGYQLIEALVSRFGLPGWFPSLALALLLVGLPIILATAYASTRQRSEPGTPASVAQGAWRVFTWRNAILGGLLAAALWGLVTAGWFVRRAASEERRSIAVLPFRNLTGDPENEYFSDGITEEIITRLTTVADLTPISLTSVMSYKDSDKTLPQIAAELGVATIVEGSVRRDADRVLVTAQLIDARSDKNLWAEKYERDLTNIFEVQGDVALRIVNALYATLTPKERARIEERPTENLQAYEYYLRGRDYHHRVEAHYENARIAEKMYEKAVEADPGFALAYARLSMAHSDQHRRLLDRSPERLRKAKQAADRALQLDPEAADAHLALGYYYFNAYEFEPAVAQLSAAVAIQPNYAEAIFRLGYTLAWSGRWEEGAASLEKAVELDPRDPEASYSAGLALLMLRDYPEAERYLNQALSLAPDARLSYFFKALLHLAWQGDTETARRLLQVTAGSLGFEAILPTFSHIEIVVLRILAAAYPEYEELVERISPAADTTFSPHRYLLKASAYTRRGEPQRARAHYDSARIVLEAGVEAQPDEFNWVSRLGLAYAGLGRKQEAIREARRGVELVPLSKNPFIGYFRIFILAEIYTLVGEYDAAIDQLELLLSIPGWVSPNLLRLDPMWDPLRDHPRFQALLEKYGSAASG